MAEKKNKQPRPRRKKLRIFLGIVLFLVVIRLILPFAVLKYVNNMLASLDGYYGKVEDIDLALYRGSYQVNSMYLNKIDSVTGYQVPFFDVHKIDLSIEWRSLFHGRIVGESTIELPKLYFKKDKVEPDELAKDTNDFRTIVDALMPLKINRFEVRRGEIHYVDSNANPYVDIKMDSVHILAENLSSVVDTANNGLPSRVHAFAKIYRGTLVFNLRLDPLAEQSRFDMNAELKRTHLPDLNNFFKAYAKVDVNRGEFDMYTELAAADGKFIGYVKPVIKDLDVVGKEDRHDSFFRISWEALVGTTATIFSNWKRDQFATKVPLEGKLSNPDANIWVSIFHVLKNAFIHALEPTIDYDVNIKTVQQTEQENKNIFQKLFKGKDPKQKEKKKKEENSKNKKDESVHR